MSNIRIATQFTLLQAQMHMNFQPNDWTQVVNKI